MDESKNTVPLATVAAGVEMKSKPFAPWKRHHVRTNRHVLSRLECGAGEGEQTGQLRYVKRREIWLPLRNPAFFLLIQRT